MTLGFVASLTCDLPSNVTQTLDPIKGEFVVAAGVRHVHSVDVAWHVYDYFKKEVAGGTFKVPLQDGVEARFPFTFTPPSYGWYIAEAESTGNGESLGGVSEQIGVAPVYANLPVKPEDFQGGWQDIPRQMFCGLVMVRLGTDGTPAGLAKLDASITLGQKLGACYTIQLTDNKALFNPDALRPIVEHFKGRVKYYELFNEPNFSFSGKDFAIAAKPVYDMIKEVDPKAQVMGPSTCGINLGFIEQFFQNGGDKACDIIAVHDYEGHESIIPEHWRYKMTALHALMAKYGQDKKDIWQTERAIAGVRGPGLLAQAQAVRTALQRNLMETLGVESDHNSHYYLNHGRLLRAFRPMCGIRPARTPRRSPCAPARPTPGGGSTPA